MKNKVIVTLVLLATIFGCGGVEEVKKTSQFNDWRQPTVCKPSGFETICQNK